MKTIAIVSGKGGTGKTSITASLAALAKDVVVADCDVDAADLHLVLKGEVKAENSFSGSKVPKINPDACISCGLCEGLCRFDAIMPPNGLSSTFTVDEIACEGCGVCAYFCPTKAIEMEETRTGKWFISETEYGPMVHAKLGIGAENSGRLVTVVRNFAKGIGEARQLPYLIIDGPPGIGCPVISSLTGVDYALVVTEPSKSGLHDLERISSLTKHFNIPTRVCINKWDISPELSKEIEEWGEKSGNNIIARIRFDNSVTKAQVNNRPVVDFSENGISEDIKTLWHQVKKHFEL